MVNENLSCALFYVEETPCDDLQGIRVWFMILAVGVANL